VKIEAVYDRREAVRRPRGGAECGCQEPAVARTMAERAVRAAGSTTHAKALTKVGSDPVVIAAGRGSACRPFLRIEKDETLFRACNALADQIGPINTPKKADRLIREAIGNEVNEVFGLVTLDLHLRMKSIAETGRGEPASVMAPMVPTLQVALIDGAHAVILFHVHPSGVEAQPSDADRKTTKAFEKSFECVGVHLLDHVIIGGDKKTYYSFAEDGAIA
jgi:DNA repair protein RadC